MKFLRRLWAGEAGFIVSAELVLVATILVLGAIVGLVSLRNAIVLELVDMGQAIAALGQNNTIQTANSGEVSVQVWPSGAPSAPPGGEN